MHYSVDISVCVYLCQSIPKHINFSCILFLRINEQMFVFNTMWKLSYEMFFFFFFVIAFLSSQVQMQQSKCCDLSEYVHFY